MKNNNRAKRMASLLILFLVFHNIFFQPAGTSAAGSEVSQPSTPISLSSGTERIVDYIYNQNGFSYSGLIPAQPLGTEIEMIGYQDWPDGFTKDRYAFAGGVFDGQSIWMLPFDADRVVKVDSVTGQMTGYNDWPAGLDLGGSGAGLFVGSFRGGAFDGENIWMVPYNASHVVKVNTATGEMTGYNNWPAEFTKEIYAFSGGIYAGNSLWLIPESADRVIELNTETGEMTGYDAWPAGFTKGSYSFAGGVYDGRNIWLIPYSADRVVKLDTETGEMTGYDAWPAGFAKNPYAFAGGVYDGQNVWLVPLNVLQVVKVNTLTGEMTSYDLPGDALQGSGSVFQGGVYDGQSIWLLPYSDGIGVVRIDKTTGEMTTYKNWPSGFSKGLGAFNSGVFDGQNIWMIPYSADRIIKLFSLTYTIEEIQDQQMIPLTEGYEPGAQEIKTMTITRSGTGELTGVAVALSGTDADAFEISQPAAATLNDELESTTFTIQAKDGLEAGTYTGLVAVTADQMADDVTFTVTQTVVGDSVLSPVTASFDKNTASAAYADVTTEIAWKGNTLIAIENGEKRLVPEIDYTLTDNVVTIKKEYLAALPAGATKLTFTFSAGKQQTLAITISNSTPVIEDVPNHSDTNDGESIPPNTHLISHAGATISFQGGQIVIPEGAWSGSFYLTINKLHSTEVLALADTLSLTAKGQFVSEVIELEKDQAGKFQKEVTIKLELTEDEDFLEREGMKVSLYWLNETANQWVELNNVTIDGEKNMISGTVAHLTKFAAIASQMEEREEAEEPEETEETVPDVYLSDISGHWAEENIRRLVAMGIVNGYPDGTFQPGKSVTRSEFVTMLVRAFQLEPEDGRTAALPFEDVRGHWAAEMISAAYDYGVIQGYAETAFGPDDWLTREQMAVMMGNLMALETAAFDPIFADQGSISDWAGPRVMAVVQHGIMDGYPDQAFRPKAFATRAEIATVILRVLEKK
ncbi:S-layer homology domain-containing protein [Paenibacillus senegalensis]|uniref:S-layer homology domain-containing protein n=1 Tax=Paenibacillus senegalensis TaxID=1465766 RepID=UPI0002882A17|nr:S-layer homology domain-containing protein [Paenibacillus senegalensis]